MICPACASGGFQRLCHNKMRILTEISSNVAVKPFLQQLSGEEFVGASITNRDEDTWLEVASVGLKSIWSFQ